MDEIGRRALLFDFYGPLLTEKQREVFDLAVGEDMSLGEIAQTMDVSRQAVHDMIRRTDKILKDYEAKLGLAEKFLDIEVHMTNIRKLVAAEPSLKKKSAIIGEIDAIDLIERK